MNKVFWRLIQLSRPHWRQMLFATALGTATVASGIGLLTTSAYIVTKAALRPSISELQVAIVGVRFFGISRAVFRYLERLISHDVNLRLLARLRVWLYRSIEPLAPAALMQAHSGDLLTRIAADVETLENLFVRIIAPPLVALSVTVSVTLIIGSVAPPLGLLLLASMLVAGAGLPLLAHYLSRADARAIVTKRAQLNQTLVDTIQGAPDLLAFNAASAQQARVELLNTQLVGLQYRMGSVSALVAAFFGLLLYLTVLGLLLIVIPLVRASTIDGVMLGVLVLAALSSFEAVQPLPLALQYLDNTLAAGHRIFEFIDQEPPVKDPAIPAIPSARSTITVENLSFRYNIDAPLALKDISFTLPINRRIALVGPSGAGKSTLVHLLLRLWEYDTGSIKLGDVELREMSQEDVRRAISIVSQSTYLFNTTVRENLLLARSDATEEDLIRATRQAQIHDLISSFPQGYDSWIGERGLQLSGGERQRLAIARAILKEAPILILDEPTAGLDTISERQIMDRLQELMQVKTTLLVTHRLIGMQAMDQILVLHRGRLVEQGTHHELLSINGLYAHMWYLQRQALL